MKGGCSGGGGLGGGGMKGGSKVVVESRTLVDMRKCSLPRGKKMLSVQRTWSPVKLYTMRRGSLFRFPSRCKHYTEWEIAFLLVFMHLSMRGFRAITVFLTANCQVFRMKMELRLNTGYGTPSVLSWLLPFLVVLTISGLNLVHVSSYLGAASGTTVSHVSDLVGPVSSPLHTGVVYAVEFSHRSGRDLINMAKNRTNVIPIIEDARHLAKYRMLVAMKHGHGHGHTDIDTI